MSRRLPHLTEPGWVRWTLIALAVGVTSALVAVPLVAVFAHALQGGIGRYLEAIGQSESRSAVEITLLTALFAVPLNVAFGVAAAWLIARFRFPGRSVLISLIDLPFSVSPVIAGLLFVLLLGREGWLGPWLAEHGVRIIFAPPGIVLATLFVTFPFVAREVLALMLTQGCQEEEAALTLGASGWRTFFRVTVPKVKWSLLYGVILCNARAMGEFGAVSVVSGHVRGLTNTVPLHVEVLYNAYDFTGAFAVASLLSVLALATLGARKLMEWRVHP